MPARKRSRSAVHRRRPSVRAGWPDLSDEALLDVRFSELGLTIAGSWLEARVAQLYEELASRGITFQPHAWLSSEWFSPDGVPGIAIPFYLAHPRLMKLEEAQMLEVEGGTAPWCMKILRHEAGHALDNAFALRSRRQRTRLFSYHRSPSALALPAPGGLRMPLLSSRTVAYWSEEGLDRLHLLSLTIAHVNERRWTKTIDTGWERWDLDVLCHPWAVARITTVQEEHGGGKRLVRVRYAARPSGYLRVLWGVSAVMGVKFLPIT